MTKPRTLFDKIWAKTEAPVGNKETPKETK